MKSASRNFRSLAVALACFLGPIHYLNASNDDAKIEVEKELSFQDKEKLFLERYGESQRLFLQQMYQSIDRSLIEKIFALNDLEYAAMGRVDSLKTELGKLSRPQIIFLSLFCDFQGVKVTLLRGLFSEEAGLIFNEYLLPIFNEISGFIQADQFIGPEKWHEGWGNAFYNAKHANEPGSNIVRCAIPIIGILSLPIYAFVVLPFGGVRELHYQVLRQKYGDAVDKVLEFVDQTKREDKYCLQLGDIQEAWFKKNGNPAFTLEVVIALRAKLEAMLPPSDQAISMH